MLTTLMHASVIVGCQGKSGPGKIHEVILVSWRIWTQETPMISTGRMSKDYLSRNIWSGRRTTRKKNLATMLFLSTEEEISTQEDIKHTMEAMAPVVVVAVVFRISIPLKVLSLTAMNEKNTKESHALNVTRMGTLWRTDRIITNSTTAEEKVQIWPNSKELH